MTEPARDAVTTSPALHATPNSALEDATTAEAISEPSAAVSQPLLSDQTNRLPTKQVIIVFLGCASAMIIGQLDQVEVSTALPSISADLGGGSHSSWVAGAYLLTATVTLPIWARLSDIFGRKNALQGALIIFSIGNIACGASQSMTGLIIARGIAGAGGGATLTCAQIIVSFVPARLRERFPHPQQINDVVSQRDRGRYQGLLSASSIVASTMGGLLGAAFTERLSWRWIFWFALPLTAISSFVIQVFLPLKKVDGNWRSKILLLDYVGAGILMTALTLLCLALNWGGVSFAWDSRQVLVTLICGVVGSLLFACWEGSRWPRLPLLPLHVFRFSTVSGVAITMFLNGAAFYAQLFYFPSFVQVVLGFSAIKSGIVLIPVSAATVLCSLAGGITVSKTGSYKPMLLACWAIWSIGLGLVSTISSETSLARIIGFWIITGLGFGPILSTSLIAATNVVKREDQAPVSALRNLSRQMGGTVFLAVAGTIIDNALISRATSLGLDSGTISEILDSPTQLNGGLPQLPQAQRTALLDAYRSGWQTICYILVGFTTLAFFIALVFIKQVELRKTTKEEREQAAAWLAQRKQRKRAGTPPRATPPEIELEARSTISVRSAARSSPRTSSEHIVRPVS